ncbi:MAG: DUF1461 domain-containing protein [Thermoleophilia bacterium]
MTAAPASLGRRQRRLALLASVLVAALVPGILVVNGLRLLANDWYVHAEYARPGFPPDHLGILTEEQRIDLALIGLRSIQPQHDEGVQLLRDARLPDGTPAFNDREVQHMQDVRDLVGGFYWAHIGSLILLVLLLAALARTPATRRYVPRALLGGVGFMVALAAVVGIMMAVAFDWFFTAFHHAFFEGMTWYFYRGDTLLRIYPNRFWNDFGFVLGGVAVVQAIVLAGGCWWWIRRTRRREAVAPRREPVGAPAPEA